MTPPLLQLPCTWGAWYFLTRVGYVPHPQHHRSEIHPPTTGHGPSLYPGVGMRTSQQPATVPFFTNCAPSPIPTLSCGCKSHLLAEDYISATHSMWLAWSPSSGPYSAPTTVIRNPIDLPHMAPYPEELGLSFLPAEGSSNLPSSYIMSEEGRE